jgi:hypothetical protein
MFLRINDVLLPLDRAVVNLKFPLKIPGRFGVSIKVDNIQTVLTDEVAETARTFFDALASKGQVIDLAAAFFDAKGKIEETKEEAFKHSTPTPLPSLNCALAPVHSQLTIPCPSCGYQSS